jgi:hypothetical protein
MAAAIAACAGAAMTPSARVDAGTASAHPATGSLSQTVHHWTAYASSGALACLGHATERQDVERSMAAMRQAKSAALAAHADPEAAINAAARTSLIHTAHRSRTSPSCRKAVVGGVQREYAASMALLPDRPTVWVGAALGDAAG